jgi:hypothetical protein
MKTAFTVLRDRPTVTVELTRNSVCAADDFDTPHKKQITIHSFTDPVAFAQVTSLDYLPSVSGYGHAWTCCLNGNKIAKIKTTGIEPLTDEVNYSTENKVHFTYHSSTY